MYMYVGMYIHTGITKWHNPKKQNNEIVELIFCLSAVILHYTLVMLCCKVDLKVECIVHCTHTCERRRLQNS